MAHRQEADCSSRSYWQSEHSPKTTARRSLLCLVWVLLGFVPGLEAAPRPNILIAFADDWGKYAHAYAGRTPDTPNDVVKTPHFDRIAKEGVLFHNAFVTAPSCTPCRSSLLSGQYFWRTGRGAILQGAVWDFKIPSFPLLLHDAGYHIGQSYKVWVPGTPRNAPYGADRFAYNSAGNRCSRFSQAVSAALDPDEARAELFKEVRDNFRSFVSERPDNTPFCYWFGPTNCHRKWIQGSGAELWGIDPDSLKGKMPPFLPDVPVIREDFADYLGEVQAFDAAVGVLLAELESMGELDNTIVLVSGDHGIPGFPRAKCNLYDFGVAVPLAVRWGDQVKTNRQVDDFVNLMDLAPTFLEAAALPIPEIMTGRSLLPVLRAEGSGQIDPSRNYVVTGRERHVASAREAMRPYPQRAIRTAQFLYIRNFRPERWPMGRAPGFGLPPGPWPQMTQLGQNTFAAFGDFDASPTKAFLAEARNRPEMKAYVDFAFGRRPAEELYDLSSDPHQMINVASSAEFQKVREELSDQLFEELRTTRDPRVSEGKQRFEHPPYTGPIE